jgi:opacity protein-like surface antigen
MRACTFTSKLARRSALTLLLLGSCLACPSVLAADAKESKTLTPEDDDFSTTPFTEYGAFNEDVDEEAETRFFQTGRFFGVSLGMGLEFVDGGRGQLYEGGFPMVDFKVHYWFDFNLALDLGFFTASHFYDTTVANGTHVDVSMFRIGLDLKYYIETKDLAAPISFANPFLLVGGGQFTKTEHSEGNGGVTETDNAFAFSLGGGLEFAIKPKKAYFQIEGKAHFANFKDSSTTKFQAESNGAIQKLDGRFYTLSANILFTW